MSKADEETRKARIERATESLKAAEYALRYALGEISRAGGPMCNALYREVQREIEAVCGTRSRLPRLEMDWGVEPPQAVVMVAGPEDRPFWGAD